VLGIANLSVAGVAIITAWIAVNPPRTVVARALETADRCADLM